MNKPRPYRNVKQILDFYFFEVLSKYNVQLSRLQEKYVRLTDIELAALYEIQCMSILFNEDILSDWYGIPTSKSVKAMSMQFLPSQNLAA